MKSTGKNLFFNYVVFDRTFRWQGNVREENVKLIFGLFSLLLMAAKTDSLCLLVETYCGVKVETNLVKSAGRITKAC